MGSVNCDAERKRSQWSAQTAAPQPPLPPPAATPAEKLAGGSQDQQAKHRTALTQPSAAASPKAAQPCAADAAQQVSAARPSSSGNRPGRLSYLFFYKVSESCRSCSLRAAACPPLRCCLAFRIPASYRCMAHRPRRRWSRSDARHTRKTGSREEILVFSPVSSAALNLGSGADASSSARSKICSSPGGTAAVTS